MITHCVPFRETQTSEGLDADGLFGPRSKYDRA